LERLRREGKIPHADVDEQGRAGPRFITDLALATAAEDAERLERKPRTAEEWAMYAATPARGPQRRRVIAKLAGKWLSSGVDPGLVLEQAHAHNSTLCVPPLPWDELERVVEWVLDRHAEGA
jgi:hypothetical protein